MVEKRTKKKTVHELVSDCYDDIEELKPTSEEIQAYADLHENSYGVVTYSKSKGGEWYFIRFHDTWKEKMGGRVHIDVGYVDEKYINKWNVPDTTHLMLDKDYAPDFIAFLKERRKGKKVIC
jgi:hypothetical protein